MLKRIIWFIIPLLLGFACCKFALAPEANCADTRAIDGVITARSHNCVELTTDDGHQWILDNVDIPFGQEVTVTFDTMWTDDVADDTVVSIVRR